MKNLEFIGIGGATCLELGGNSCFYKENNKLLIVDVCECATGKLFRAKAFENINEIFIAITHTHFDHVAGLGTLIWYCNFYLNIMPKIIYSDNSYLQLLKQLLKITGVDEKFFDLIEDKDFKINDLKMKYIITKHEPSLQCHGIMFEDNNGKYYYTGDTNDINYVKQLNADKSVKRIYCEICTESYGVHIKYEDLLKIKNDKIVPMHFNTINLYRLAIKDGFNMPNYYNIKQ